MSNIDYAARIRSQAGAKRYYRQSGTSTPQNTYQDIDLTTPHANPVVADADGLFPVIYLDPSLPNYRIIHTDGSNVDDDYTLEVLLEDILDDIPSGLTVASVLRIRSTNPQIILEETDGAANGKKWAIDVNGGLLSIAYLNDAESLLLPYFQIDRVTGQVRIPSLYTPSSSGASLDISALTVGNSAYIVKTANESFGTTLSSDSVLKFTSAPAGTYHVEGMITFLSPAAADFKVAWPRCVGVSGAMQVNSYSTLDAAAGVGVILMSSTTQTYATADNIFNQCTVDGIETATAGQALGPQFAQAVASGTTTVYAGSWLKVTRLT